MIEFILFLVLMIAGYSFGTYREKAHYKTIRQQEAKYKDIMLFESRFPPSTSQAFDGQIVQGNVVISVDYFKKFVAGLRMLIGGNLNSYETLLDRGRREAIIRMKKAASTKGTNRIFNIKFETSSISKGANGSVGSIEVLVYGSAINVIE